MIALMGDYILESFAPGGDDTWLDLKDSVITGR